MLERVSVPPKHLDDYAQLVEPGTIERIAALAAPLHGARVLHVNATAYGGGVAELLATHVALLQSVGVAAEWEVIAGSDEFFAVTKSVHNALQGTPMKWTKAMARTYLKVVEQNAARVEGEWDYVVIHDPQPAAMRSFLRDAGAVGADAKWIWRCHIDLTDANESVWRFFQPFVEQHDASVWTMAQYVPSTLGMANVAIAPPCIDPLSEKNAPLDEAVVASTCARFGIDVDRPLLVQVSRFDPWKDPVGVIEAYRIARESVPGLQLVMAGSMASDDPEGQLYWDLTAAAAGDDPDVKLLSNLQGVGALEINAFQQAADVVIQKSLREGFGLTVSEGLWKGRPVIGGRAGGITMQINDGIDGFLVDSVEECAARCVELLADPARCTEMGRLGREHVRRHFLSTRELEDWLRLFNELR